MAKDDERQVAIKILPQELAQQTEFRKRFEREAKTLAALDHPNIVKVYGYGESEGIPYMAMEYIDGQELGAVTKRRGRLPLDDARPIIGEAAAALDYAHQRGLVHRDIKPSNMMLRPRQQADQGEPSKATPGLYQVLLTDFGIAKLQDARTELTGSGAVGTIDYMAPEQIMTAKEVDGRADIYALGVVLYEILTGERPFKGSPGQILFAHLQQPTPDPRDLVPDLPALAALAVLKAMSKKPEDRFQTAGEFAAALM